MLIPGYPEGSDLTILDTIYQRPTKREDGKWDNDKLIVLFKDNITGKKDHYIFENMYNYMNKIIEKEVI